MRSKKSLFVVILFSIVCTWIVFNRNAYRESPVLDWDKSGYYIYLPAAFIYHDLAKFSFYNSVNERKNFTPNAKDYGLYPQPNGKKVNKYAIGVSVLQLPFFLLAHGIAYLTNRQTDGYSTIYLLAIIFSCINYVVFGLIMLRKLLLQHFSDNVTALALLCIAFGTNLYNYTAFEQGMSHTYSFFLFSTCLFYLNKYYYGFKLKDALILGCSIGLITITRPTNLLILLALPLWGITTNFELKNRITQVFNNYKSLLICILGASLVVFIQLSYWKYSTGNWIHFSYEEEGFNFRNPEIINGLFSYRKGWLVYSPIVVFSLIGLMLSFKKMRFHSIGITIFLLINIYVIFSWHQWYYGGGFGARPLIETLAIMIFPLAYFIKSIFKLNIIVRASFVVVCLALITLNLFQTYQFSRGVIPWDHTNKAYYWRIFGKIDASDEDKSLINWEEK